MMLLKVEILELNPLILEVKSNSKRV